MIWRLALLLAHLLGGALVSLVVTVLSFVGHPPVWQSRVVQWWHQRLCHILALRIQVTGQSVGPALLVANHISWLDIPVLGAQGAMGFLSKAQVRHWPLIGWMAEVAGTLFIERGAHRATAVMAALRARLVGGASVVVFAEGTTSDGTQVRRFLPRLFAVVQPDADRHNAPMTLQPVALRYDEPPGPDAIAPFIGEDTLVRHLLRVLQHPGLSVSVMLLPPIAVGHHSRRALAEAARDAIVTALGCADSAAPAPFHRPVPALRGD